ncbi:MAG: hypothetical protein ACR2O8_08490 [Rhizobiaceae bacterium]
MNKNSNQSGKKRKGTGKFARYVRVLAVALGVLALALTLLKVQQRISAHEFTTETTSRQFILGNDVLEIPLNHMRFANQRESDALDQADLIMTWPTGEGFTDANGDLFLKPDRIDSLVFLTVTRREMPLSMSDRLEAVYSKLFQGQPRRGPAGLALRKLRDGSGYDGEELAIAPTSIPPWVARCQIDNGTGQAVCLRDVFAGAGLSIRYRFHRTHLPHWQRMERLVQKAVEQIVVTPQ